jgi:hypothetical protein
LERKNSNLPLKILREYRQTRRRIVPISNAALRTLGARARGSDGYVCSSKWQLAKCSIARKIPVKVSINEYLELCQNSTARRAVRIFVNGILDKILYQLRRENRIQKNGTWFW